MEPSEREVEELLRRSRPEPSAAWVAHTGRRLLPPRRERLWRRPAVRLGSALAGGLASLAIVFALAGVGPLGGGGDAVKARSKCRSVTTVTPRRTPYLVIDRRGRPQIRYRRQTAPHAATRCP